jgi:hypothetical protein
MRSPNQKKVQRARHCTKLASGGDKRSELNGNAGGDDSTSNDDGGDATSALG